MIMMMVIIRENQKKKKKKKKKEHQMCRKMLACDRSAAAGWTAVCKKPS
jgi:hypothetical protein